MKICAVQNVPIAEWDTIWKACDYATYFHSPGWAAIWEAYTRNAFEQLHAAPLLVSFSDGQKALLPLSRYTSYRGLVHRYVSSPAGTFGGWISKDKLTPEHARLLNSYMLQKLPALAYRVNPYNPHSILPETTETEAEATSVLELEDDFETIFRRWSKGHKAAVTQARKFGLEVHTAETEAEWKQYFAAYTDSVKRWGKDHEKAYQWELFRMLFEKNTEDIKLWVAVKEGKVVAGALCLYAKRHVAYWHGAALQAYFKMRPVNLLLYEAIRHARQSGYHWFDFNPSGKLQGVKAFKKSFGTEEKACPYIVLYDTSLKHQCVVGFFRTLDKLKRKRDI